MPAALAIVLGGVDITTSVEFSSIVMQPAGSQEIATCEFDIVDEGLTISATPESTLTVTEVSSATVLFGGFTRSPRTVLTAIGRLIHVKAYDYNGLLDRSIVVSDSRTAGESDHARLVYLMGVYGSQFSSDYTQIATLNASLPAQKFIAITLRQAIERVLGQASFKSSYYVDATGRLNTYDRTVPVAAPFNINIASPPGGGNIAPDDFEHDRDTDNIANAIYVVGATAAGSGWFTDVTSISTYGRRERFFNAPDSDTHAKASQVGLAVLGDQKDPVPRATFTTQSPNDGWRIGQSITVTSPQDNLAGVSLRIAKITTHYLNPAGAREYAIELGAPQATLSALLAAAHGGGGGFPWHSPGGAAGWSFPVSSGTTGGGVSGGGGCACNTPYAGCIVTTYDNFNRTVSAAAGTASGGWVWSNVTTPGGSDYGVNGSQLFCGLSGGTFRVRTSTGPYTTSSATLGATRFYFVQPAGVFANYESFTMYFEGTGGTIGWTWSLNVTTFSIFTAGGATQTYTYPAAWRTFDYSTTPIWFDVKWQIDWATGDISAKIWLETDGEPSAYQVVMPTAAVSPLSGTIRFDCQVSSSFTTRAGYVDFINMDPVTNCLPPNSGQPYSWTNLGTGNGVQTAFSTLTPFRPGSLSVRVGANLVTPSSQDATTGAFVLPFPPSSIETIWAMWVVA